MAENTHIQELIKVRKLLVEKRRHHAKTVQTNVDGWFPDIVRYQEAIEVIDRAIKDETALSGPGPFIG